jgi:hypothetical protein
MDPTPIERVFRARSSDACSPVLDCDFGKAAKRADYFDKAHGIARGLNASTVTVISPSLSLSLSLSVSLAVSVVVISRIAP